MRPGTKHTVHSRTARFGAVGMVGALVLTVVGIAPSASAESVGELRERARRIATELEVLDRATEELDESYNVAGIELEALRLELKATEVEVSRSEAELDANRFEAQAVAVEAFVGSNDPSRVIGGGDGATDSRRRTYLGTRYGDSREVIESLVAAQKDLADRRTALSNTTTKVEAKVAQVEQATARIEATISKRKALLASVSGELASALEVERDRLARVAAARVERDARASAARAQAARRTRPVVVPAANAPGSDGGVAPGQALVGPAANPAPSARNITPPPADAPRAVQVALEQLGDPYRWAGAGPDRFDCSGLVQFAYAAAGISLPHSSRALRAMTRSLSADELQPGDLVFGGSPVHHVGIYIGDGEMVHSPQSGDVVKVSSIYRTSRPVSFGRL